MVVPPFIFREYDVRGVAERDLGDDTTRAIGAALVGMLEARRGQAPRIVLGRDCRLSSPRLHAAMKEGLLAGGGDVLDVGVGPTPHLYFAVHHTGADGGVMVTGSHNAPEDNGFKVMRACGSFSGVDLQNLRARLEVDGAPSARGRPTVRGVARTMAVASAYVADLAGSVSVDPTMKVVVDAGNGAGGPLALAALRALGLEPDPLYCEMDGRFPNHHPDPSVPANLARLVQRVRETGARVGLAYDGDADRLGAVDADGEIVSGDRLMILFARRMLADNPGAAIVGEVKCSETLYDDIRKHGGRAVMGKAGRSFVKTKMAEERALFAGELSGHLFFADRRVGYDNAYDDAIYASLRLLEILSNDPRSIGEMLADVPRTYCSPELRIECPEGLKQRVVDGVTEHYEAAGRTVVAIDGARIQFGTEGGGGAAWGLVRASTTGPVLVLRFEAESSVVCDAIRDEVLAVVQATEAALRSHA
jgi:phosphomannomutase/phosphoglucomutase